MMPQKQRNLLECQVTIGRHTEKGDSLQFLKNQINKQAIIQI